METENPKQRVPSVKQRLKQWARKLKSDSIAIYFALKHPQTPIYARVVAAIVVGYALSPIDVIPDFIPVLGYLDDVILLPLGIALAIKLIPAEILHVCRQEVKKNPPVIRPKIWLAAYVIVLLWLSVLYVLYEWI